MASGDLPSLIEIMCLYLMKKGRSEEGIFRISPIQNQLKSLRNKLNEEGSRWLIKDINTGNIDVHTVAALLKLILSELSDPVLGLLLDCDVDASSSANTVTDKKVLSAEEFHYRFSLMSPENQTIGKVVLSLLHHLCSYSSATKMGAAQFSVVLAPCLFGCPDSLAGLSRLNRATQVLENLIIDKLWEVQSPRIHQYVTDLTDNVWVDIVKNVVHEKLFLSPSISSPDLPTEKSANLKVSQTSAQAHKNGNTSLIASFDNISTNPSIEQSVPGKLISQSAPSTRTAQLTKIVNMLCEKFDINDKSNRKHSASPVEEKVALQKALLQLESNYGRPVDKVERQIVRPLYERYRELKRVTGSHASRGHRYHHKQLQQQQQQQHQQQQQRVNPPMPSDFNNSTTNGADNNHNDAIVRWATPSTNTNRYNITTHNEIDSQILTDLDSQQILARSSQSAPARADKLANRGGFSNESSVFEEHHLHLALEEVGIDKPNNQFLKGYSG